MWVALTREKMASVRPRFFTRPLIFISISLSPSYGIVRLYLLWKLSLAIFSPKISYPGSTHLHKPGGEKLQLKMKKQSRKQRLEKYNKEEEAWTHNRPLITRQRPPFKICNKNMCNVQGALSRKIALPNLAKLADKDVLLRRKTTICFLK